MTIVCLDSTESLIAELWFDVHIIRIIHRCALNSYDKISTKFRLTHIIAIIALTRIADEVSRAVLTLTDMRIFLWLFLTKSEELLSNLFGVIGII